VGEGANRVRAGVEGSNFELLLLMTELDVKLLRCLEAAEIHERHGRQIYEVPSCKERRKRDMMEYIVNNKVLWTLAG